MPFEGKWMELEVLILHKISQTQKIKYHTVTLCKTNKKTNYKVKKEGGDGRKQEDLFLEMQK